MQKTPTILIISIYFLIFFSGCATKKMVKKAGELESAGMFRAAAELYYQAVKNKPGKIDYISGLRRAGFMYIEDAAQEIKDAYSRNDYEKVVYDYITIDAFITRSKALGVDFELDQEVRNVYRNAQSNYLEDQYQDGLKLINEERYDEAKAIFSEIVRINPEYKDSRSYLNTATLEPLYRSGTEFFNQKNYMAAYNEWSKVVASDNSYKDTRQRMDQALNERYKEGTLWLMQEDFSAAARALGEVYSVNNSYLDVKNLYTEARNEPLYRNALESMNNGRCRDAYLTLSAVLEDAEGTYKDASDFQSKALKCAEYPVVVISNEMPNHASDGAEFENALLQQILNSEDPFIKIFTLPGLNPRMGRSMMVRAGSLNRAQMKELHDRYGIKAVMMLNFSQYNKMTGRFQRSEKTGFERENYTKEDGVMAYRDRLVTYQVVSAKNQVTLSLSYQLIATHNGQILLTNRLNLTESDDLNYANYEGEARKLYPANYINNNWVLDERSYSSLQRLLNADKELVPVEKLKDGLFKSLSAQIAKSVIEFNPER
jgi:tetratricopeptide (TPR) repeat protein